MEHPHIYGIEVLARHCNTMGVVHGGMLATVADSALGAYGIYRTGQNCLTVSLSLDYLASAREVDFLVAEVRIIHTGHKLFFAEAHLRINPGDNEKLVMRASGVFSLIANIPSGEITFQE